MRITDKGYDATQILNTATSIEESNNINLVIADKELADTQNPNTRTAAKSSSISHAKIKSFRESEKKSSSRKEDDPFNLELKIDPKRVQGILTVPSAICGSQNDDCTGCGCNSCCSSC